MKEKLYKIGFVVAIVLLLVAGGFVVKMQWDAKKRQEALAKQMVEMKQLQDGIARSQSKYVSQENFEAFAKNLDLDLDIIKEDLKKFDAEIRGISSVIVSSRGRIATGLPSSGTDPGNNPGEVPSCPDGTTCPDPYGYLTDTQHQNLTEPFDDVEVPIGRVSFEAWKENPWSLHILPRQYKVSTVLGMDEEGRHYVHNRFQINADGKDYTVPIQQAEFVEKFPESEFRFDPHFNLGVSVGAAVETSTISPDVPRARVEVQPTFDVSLFSYGQTKVNPEWTFLGIGVGYETQNSDLGIVVHPFSYNLGQQIPFIRNLYVGPTVGTDTHGRVFAGAGIRVGL